MDSVSVGLASSAGGAAATLALQQLSKHHELKHLSESLEAPQLKTTIANSLEALKSQRQVMHSRLSSKQLATIDKHIAKLSKGLEQVDEEGVELLKLWRKLDAKLPTSLLQGTGLDSKTLTQLEQLAPELVGKSREELQFLLKGQYSLSVSDELVDTLAQAATVNEIKGMTKVLRHGSKVNRIVQTLSGAMLVDVAFLGFDVWTYLETKKEAELIAKVNQIRAHNKMNQANVQLGIGLASVAVEAAIIAYAVSAGTAVGGPFGMLLGLGVGGVSAAVSMGVDSLYFDVQDFYTQNQEDFLRQSRGRLKHAILQGLHNHQQGNVSLNEKVHSGLAELFAVEGKDRKELSLKEACFSMLFLEELEFGALQPATLLLSYVESGLSRADFLTSLSFEERMAFEQQWEEVAVKVNTRLEYIEQAFQKPSLIEQLQSYC